ncbi:MAG: hypothetical protein LBD99_04615, partial [Candidatus Margulisbacteria bacterium]|nr:hypothetical protein [Candidatus Margulisiibacteriota bacterium]
MTVTYGTKATEINMGQNKAVLVFDVAGSDTFTGISLRNDSDVPFYKYGVDRVELRSGVDNDGSGGSSIASKAFATNELPATELNLSFSPPAGAGRYAVIYNISAEAKKYTPKDSSSYVYAKAYLTGVATANGTYEPTDTGFSNVDVVVWAAGLINLPDKVKNMLQSNNIVAPDSLVPMLTFTLRAEGYPATINYVSISSSGNFATDQTNGDEMVKEVILLADEDGIGDYGGLSRENIVCRLDLTTSHTGDHDEIKLSLNQVVTLSAYATSGGISNKQVSEKKFWVLYRLGKGIPRDTQLSCSLIGGNAGELRGDFPVGNVSTVVKDYDARLISVVPADAYNVVSGERGIKMLEFSYDVKHEIKDVTLEIYNGGGTFAPRNSDKGVNRVYLYKKNVNDNTLLAVGDISST